MINRHRKALDVVEREESWIHQESWDNTYLWRRFQRSYICHEIQFHLSLSIKQFSWSLGYLVLQSRGLISEINTLVDKSNGLIGNFVVALMKWVCHTSTTSSDSDTNSDWYITSAFTSVHDLSTRLYHLLRLCHPTAKAFGRLRSARQNLRNVGHLGSWVTAETRTTTRIHLSQGF